MSELDIFESMALQDFRRGLLKLFILKMLDSGELHGYGVMKRLEEITHGKWKPSPGSVYPVLKNLEKLKLIRSRKAGSKKIYSITPQGQTILAYAKKNFETVKRDITTMFNKL